MTPLKLCLLSSEIMPYAKSGGLADVAGALTQELRTLGHDVRAFMPLYATVRRSYPQLQPVLGAQNIRITMGTHEYVCALQTASYPDTDIPVYFVDCPELYDRLNYYTFDADEHLRFLVFTRAVLEGCQLIKFLPDIFHCNDWHTAMLPLYLKTLYAHSAAFAHSRSMLTIHNIGYQGVMSASALPDLELGDGALLLDADDLARNEINPLKSGIKLADSVTTVSPTYAHEIAETPLGMGMQATLQARTYPVAGILNGVEYREWDPRHDKYLSVHFDPEHLQGKQQNKLRLLKTMGLTLDPARPLVCMVSRLAEQKGIDLLFNSLPVVLQDRDCGFMILGSGDPQYVAFFEGLARRFPGRVAFRPIYEESLAHLIEAGSDILLMPSRYEPCGLNQMYSLRYGTIPVVRKTGGLADSVRHFDPATGDGTGIVFNDFDAPAVQWGLDTALDWYNDKPLWQRLMQNAMAEDFSWHHQVELYEVAYRELIARG